MPTWWFWLILSGLWLLTGILHAANGRTGIVLILYFSAALLSAVLGLSKRFCDQRGAAGKRIFCIVGIFCAALLALLLLFLLLTHL